MLETILLICTLLIIVPILMAVIGIYNLKRSFEGLPALSGPEALKDMIKKLLGQANQSKAKSKKNSVQTPENKIEDAEFREK